MKGVKVEAYWGGESFDFSQDGIFLNRANLPV